MVLHVEGGEDLADLAGDRHIVILGEVLDKLLGEGGAAEGVAHAQEHVDKGAGGAVPVHPVMIPEAVVLNGHHRVDQILWNILIVHPLLVLRSHQGSQLPGLAIVIIIVDNRVLVEGVGIQIQRGVGQDCRFDVDRGVAGQESPCHDANQEQGPQNLEDPKEHCGHCGTFFSWLLSSIILSLRPASAPGLGVPLGRVITMIILCHSNTSDVCRRAISRVTFDRLSV